jgi:hypothetical protein
LTQRRTITLTDDLTRANDELKMELRFVLRNGRKVLREATLKTEALCTTGPHPRAEDPVVTIIRTLRRVFVATDVLALSPHGSVPPLQFVRIDIRIGGKDFPDGERWPDCSLDEKEFYSWGGFLAWLPQLQIASDDNAIRDFLRLSGNGQESPPHPKFAVLWIAGGAACEKARGRTRGTADVRIHWEGEREVGKSNCAGARGARQACEGRL